MMNKNDREFKILAGFLAGLLIIIFWGQFSGFKLFKPESGTTWNATGPHPSAHHK